ncbi:NnrU family protein [Qipengyuania gelatinilytica]|uniref:NnrU family protein n=1 Tax=Qipengyuania gelatinilytica TaxID=2867231 RepID=A0ABX9A131_9SPHN|nr:NnrU family protein [Qipengyuania gelatinilytica]QZD94039.1 NnrU family protein [Qipengyuania gelatinilytica]
MTPLLALLAASIAFVGTHFALSHPLRAPIVSKLGENGFRGVYSLVALATFVWVVMSFRAVGPGGAPLWNGMGDGVWIAATIIMLVASVLLAGSFIRNPAMPAPGAEKLAAQDPHGVFNITRHPMMWSFALWAAVHILLSPTPRQFILAGAVGFLALVGAHMQDRKKEVLMGDAWAGWEAKTSYWPRFGALLKAGPAAWIGGIVIWLLATFGHIHANGIPAGIWRWVG